MTESQWPACKCNICLIKHSWEARGEVMCQEHVQDDIEQSEAESTPVAKDDWCDEDTIPGFYFPL